MWQDVRQALRLLARQPAFAAAAVLSLGLGLSAALSVFALVNALLVRDLPFKDPERLVWMYNARVERDRAPLSMPDLDDYRRDNTSLEQFAMFGGLAANLTGAGEPERLEGVRVTGEFFEVLGASPALGRVIEAADAASGGRVVVLTNKLWIRRFAADPAIIGRSITLNGTGYLVVGVLPPGFLFPLKDGELAVPLSLGADPRRSDRGANFLRVVARLKPGIQISQAEADLDRIARRLQQMYPDANAKKTGISLYPLHSEIVMDYGPLLRSLFAAVVVLIVVGCGNLANLFLVRGLARTSELAIRHSLGASRARIGRQLIVEAGAIVGAGLLVGLVGARLCVGLWRAWGPSSFPRMEIVSLDWRVLGFGLGLAGLAVLICAVPAMLLSGNLSAAASEGGRTLTTSARHVSVRHGFVVVQVAGCALLLLCMGLVAKGFANLERVDAGFTPDRALTMQLSLPSARYSTREAVVEFYDAVAVRLAAMPGHVAAGAVSLLPLSALLNTMDLSFPGQPPPAPDAVPQAHVRVAGPGYFEAAGIRVLDGRTFTVHDTADGLPVAVVSQSLAERHWPGVSAVGQQVRLNLDASEPPLTVVGVVNDVKQFTIDAPATADLYVSVHQMPDSQRPTMTARMSWVVRTHAASPQLEAAVRAAVHEIDPEVATSSTRSLEAVRDNSLASRRMTVRLLEVFGQVAVVLAAIGVYAIAAYSARARRRELAIRSAFGANRRDLVRLVLRGEFLPVVVGLGIGLVAGAFVGPRLAGSLFGIHPWDVATYATVAIVLIGVGLLATWLPARRASAADPLELLRS